MAQQFSHKTYFTDRNKKFKSNCNPSFGLLWLQLSKNYYGNFFLLEDKGNVISENFLISKSWLSFVKSLRNDSDIKFVADKPLNTGEMSRGGGAYIRMTHQLS